MLREVLLHAAREIPISSVRAAHEGVNCVIELELELYERQARVVSVWHVTPVRPPHLVTAYPRP